MLPYQTLKPTEEAVIAGIPMAKRGCLTVAEMQAAADLGAELEETMKGLTLAQQDLLMKQHVITILLRSRVDRGWTLEQTKAPEWQAVIDGKAQTIEPDMLMLDELFQFFIGEQRQWQEPKEEPHQGKKQLTGRKSTGS